MSIRNKINTQKLIQARNDLGKVREKANNLPDSNDKLTLLKLGYLSAIDAIPDHTKHNHNWIFQDVVKYTDKLASARSRNLLMMDLYPKNTKGYLKCVKNDQIYVQRLDDVENFIKKSLRNGVTYVDNYIVLDVDNNYHAVYPNYLEFDDYLKPYRAFLQAEYEKIQHKNINLDKYKRDNK